ncbi:L,D-transpeptidase family protein [Streptomyces sp. NPDC048718]|uniref:L,D-transpeptidase family protein n=1 Tax=Streptomyces sp. NPDC048718 TaxID=3365587 RepID=UPI00370FE354
MSAVARKTLVSAVFTAVLTGGLLAGSLAPAASAHTPAAPAHTPAAHAATSLVFDKNQKNPADSRLLVYRGKKLVASYRAGSGTGVKNDCTRNKGWMPNGSWKIRSKSRTYGGRYIKGYAVYLQDMSCSKGTTKRREMFIHSEMNRDGSQGRTEARRWDGASDYKSNGCVKVSPTDIKKMFRLLDRIGWPTHLRVVS